MSRLISDDDQLVGINEPNEHGYTPLLLLVRNNQDESLLKCIKRLLDSRRQDCGATFEDIVNKKVW